MFVVKMLKKQLNTWVIAINNLRCFTTNNSLWSCLTRPFERTRPLGPMKVEYVFEDLRIGKILNKKFSSGLKDSSCNGFKIFCSPSIGPIGSVSDPLGVRVSLFFSNARKTYATIRKSFSYKSYLSLEN